jgi:hypothetical protein
MFLMDKQLPPDFDPYGSAKNPPHNARDPGQQPQEGGDDDPPEHGLSPNHGSPPMTDSRFSFFLQWFFGIAASLVTVGIVWVAGISVSTARKVDVLLDRPESVPRWQYENDARQIKEDLNDTQRRVTAVEQRQLDAIARGYEQRANSRR